MTSSIDLGPPPVSFNRSLLKTLRLSPPPPPKDLNLTGQVGIITGGNTGLGFACAQTLLTYKLSHLIITVRNEKKGIDAVAKLNRLYPGARIEAWSLDMLSYNSIQAFTQRCTSLNRIDFVILNAGLQNGEFVINPSTKHEIVFQVNYLSTVLLTLLLLPILKEKHAMGKPGRVTIVGSGLALSAKFTEKKFDPIIPAFDDSKGWGMRSAAERYSTTKLLLLMFVVKLKDYVDADEVAVNVADPGFMRNGGMDQTVPFVLRSFYGIFRALVGRDIKAGVWAFVDAAVVKPHTTHGSWTYNWAVYSFPSMMYTQEGKRATERLWKETVAELEFADVRGILSSIGKK